MYIVNCSSCGQAEKSLFARVGAVMTCPSCKTAVQLRAEDVKRQFKVRADLDDDLFRVPQVPRAEEPPAFESVLEAPTVAEETQASEIHEDHAELAAEAERRAEAVRRRKPKAQPIVARAGMSSGELAQHLARKRHMQTAGILVGVAAVAIVVILVIISSASNKAPATKDATDVAIKDGGPPADGAKDGAVAPPPPTDGEKDKLTPPKDQSKPITPGKDNEKDQGKDKTLPPAMIRVYAAALGIDEWQPTNEAFLPTTADGSVVLINDSSERQESGDHLFKADIVANGVASALISVTLVNDEDRVYAKFERPYFLLEGRKARPLKLTIPKSLVGTSTGVHWSVYPIDAHIKNPTLLADTLAEIVKGDKPVVRIDAYNPSDRQLKDTAFVLQALDSDGQIVSQWRLKFPHEVGARSWVKFEAELPAAAPKNAAAWRVQGAGIPTGEVLAPPPPDPRPEERDPKEPIPRRTKGLFDF